MVGEGYGYGYNDFLGIGEKKKKVKTIAQGVVARTKADENFKKQMIRLYQNTKADLGIRDASLRNIEKENGLEATYQVVQTFGSPTNEKSLEKHNTYVSIFTKYFIPSEVGDGVDCKALMTLLGELESDAEVTEKRLASGGRADIGQASSLAIAERGNQVKKLMVKANCQAKFEAEESAKATQETLSTLQQATGGSPTQKSDNTTKYITYGVGGVVILIAMVLLLRKN
jgi:hypothetical protein